MSVPVRLLKGTDPVALSDAATAAVDELVGDAERAEVLDEFSGDDYELGAVVMAANSVSMFGDRVVVARNCARFPAEEQRLVIAYLESPNPTTSLVLVWDRPVTAGAKAQSVSKKLTDAVKAAGGAVTDCDPPSQARARQGWLEERVSRAPVRLTPAAMQLLSERLGEDVARVAGVLDLLASTFAPGSRLSPEEVEPYLGEAGGVPPWELTDAIDRGDVTAALDRVQRMMAGGDRHPLQVMATLHTHYERILRLDGAAVRTEAEAASLLGLKGSTFPAKKAIETGRRLGSEGVARAIALLAAADLDLRGAVDWPPELVMEVLVARLARLGGPRRSSPQSRTRARR